MEDKDTLGKMFMDMGKANEWARQVMYPDEKGQKYWTDMIDDFTSKTEEDTNHFGWAAEGPEFVTLYQFLGEASGKDIGIAVFNASVVMGVKSIKRSVRGSEIEYRAYPKAWLEMWFRDYDAQLSMEVYNKAKAKEALNQINNKSK